MILECWLDVKLFLECAVLLSQPIQAGYQADLAIFLFCDVCHTDPSGISSKVLKFLVCNDLGIRFFVIRGSSILIFLPINSSAELSEHQGSGVAL